MLHVALFYTILSLAMECPTQITQIMYLIQKHFFSEFLFTEFLGKYAAHSIQHMWAY